MKTQTLRKPLRILFIWGHMEIGGAETVGLSIARTLKKKGHHIAYLSQGGPLVRDLEEEGIPHYWGKVDTKNPISMILASYLVEKITQKEKIDVYYCNNLAQTTMGYLAANRVFHRTHQRPPLITVMHGHEKAIYYYLSSPLYNFFSDHVTGVCEFERKRLLAHGLNPRKASTIYNALSFNKLPFPAPDPEKFRKDLEISSQVPLAGYVGRLSPEKDVGTLIKAMAVVVKSCPSAMLAVVGDGPERSYLEWLTRELHLESNVRFLGYRRDIPQIFSGLNVACLSSTRELFPMIALEAFYYKCPVVATDVGGLGEVVKDGETGYKVPPCDPEKLGEKILQILQNRDLQKKMGETGRSLVLENFDLEKNTSHLEELFYSFLEKKSHS